MGKGLSGELFCSWTGLATSFALYTIYINSYVMDFSWYSLLNVKVLKDNAKLFSSRLLKKKTNPIQKRMRLELRLNLTQQPINIWKLIPNKAMTRTGLVSFIKLFTLLRVRKLGICTSTQEIWLLCSKSWKMVGGWDVKMMWLAGFLDLMWR